MQWKSLDTRRPWWFNLFSYCLLIKLKNTQCMYAVIACWSNLHVICDILPYWFPVVVFCHRRLDICSGLCNGQEFTSSFLWHLPYGLNYIFSVLGVSVNHLVSTTAQRFVGLAWIMRLWLCCWLVDCWKIFRLNLKIEQVLHNFLDFSFCMFSVDVEKEEHS